MRHCDPREKNASPPEDRSLRLPPVSYTHLDVYKRQLYESIEHSYGRKGKKVVNMNKEAVTAGMSSFREVAVTAEWATAADDDDQSKDKSAFVREVLRPMAANRGNDLPVSAFSGREDGTFPSGGSQYEKRGVASFVPRWIKENCIQCNQCSLVCPHASIRPIIIEDGADKPDTFATVKALSLIHI